MLLVSAYIFIIARFKKPGPKAFKCEDCSRSFSNKRALGQHLNSKVHAHVINHDEDIPLTARSPPVAFDSPLFKPLVPGPIDFDDRPEKEVEFPRKDTATSKLFILTPLLGKGQGLIVVQDISKGTRIISEKPLFRIPRSRIGIEQLALEKAIDRKLSLLSQDGRRAFLSLYNNAPGDSYPLSGIVKTNALPLGTSALEGGLFLEASRINHACVPNC